MRQCFAPCTRGIAPSSASHTTEGQLLFRKASKDNPPGEGLLVVYVEMLLVMLGNQKLKCALAQHCVSVTVFQTETPCDLLVLLLLCDYRVRAVYRTVSSLFESSLSLSVCACDL